MTATAGGPAASDAAAAYQRLRGHLAYLKLNAAIEALPALLDEARDGQLGVLDALERLMGTEAAAEARKLASRLHTGQRSPPPSGWRTTTSPPSPAPTRTLSASSPPSGSSTLLVTSGIRTC